MKRYGRYMIIISICPEFNNNNNNNNGEKMDKYLDLSREQKKLWDGKVTVMPIIVGTLDENLDMAEKGKP